MTRLEQHSRLEARSRGAATPEEDREESLLRVSSGEGDVQWLPEYDRPGSFVDADDTWGDR